MKPHFALEQYDTVNIQQGRTECGMHENQMHKTRT